MSNGQATKIVFPFEISALIRQAARFLGETPEEPPAGPLPGTCPDLSILGDIPKRQEVEKILQEMEDAVPDVSETELKDPSRRLSRSQRDTPLAEQDPGTDGSPGT